MSVKGHKSPLNHTKQSRERIIAGLSWDPREDKVSRVRHMLKTDSQHDLDISCYVYDATGQFIDFVGAEAQDSVDQSGKIYHSGDDMTGAGEGDDEQISAELAALPAHVHGLVFLVEIKSRHTFSEIDEPMCHLADAMSNQDLFMAAMAHDDAADKNAFVMCSIYRDSTNDSGWTLYNISEYPDISKIEDWGTYLAQFVD